MYNSFVQAKDNLSFDDVCELLTVSYIADSIGQQIPGYTTRKTFCARYSIPRQEYYQARSAGIRAEILICIDATEYKNETFLKYGGEEYSIYKVYERADGAVELYCARKVGQ